MVNRCHQRSSRGLSSVIVTSLSCMDWKLHLCTNLDKRELYVLSAASLKCCSLACFFFAAWRWWDDSRHPCLHLSPLCYYNHEAFSVFVNTWSETTTKKNQSNKKQKPKIIKNVLFYIKQKETQKHWAYAHIIHIIQI